MIREFDKRRDLAIPGNSEETIEFAASHFVKVGMNAIKEHGSFFVALSGGSTPKKIFAALLQKKHKESLDWSKVFLFWSDERAVSPTSPESNYKMAMDAGFKALKVPENQIFRMHAEENIEENALAYERLIQKTLNNRPFDLIMLGMGDDGHTASLFPKTQALEETERLVTANFVAEKDAMRMTFTFSLINTAKHIALYVLGEEKSKRVASVLRDTLNTFPAARVGTPSHKALWILDEAASRELLKTPFEKGLKKKIS